MHIEWNIVKKRGNLRPVLTYTVRLEEHEKALALPGVSILSSIPKPEEDRQEYCYPGQFERRPETGERNEGAASGGQSGLAARYELEAPSHRGHPWARTLRLPWRESNEYPEVEASFLLLRQEVERELERASGSAPLKMQGALRTSPGGRQGIAPAILAERLLKSAERAAASAGA